jgi:hypothetical protein
VFEHDLRLPSEGEGNSKPASLPTAHHHYGQPNFVKFAQPH